MGGKTFYRFTSSTTPFYRPQKPFVEDTPSPSPHPIPVCEALYVLGGKTVELQTPWGGR